MLPPIGRRGRKPYAAAAQLTSFEKNRATLEDVVVQDSVRAGSTLLDAAFEDQLDARLPGYKTWASSADADAQSDHRDLMDWWQVSLIYS
jgi:hypothetical protein